MAPPTLQRAFPHFLLYTPAVLNRLLFCIFRSKEEAKDATQVASDDEDDDSLGKAPAGWFLV